MTGPTAWLPGTGACVGCGAPRHHTVGATPCAGCGAPRWTLAVAGSRTLTDPHRLWSAARPLLADLVDRHGVRPAVVLHGDAAGADRILAARLTQAGWRVEPVRAGWDVHGRRAGVLRTIALLARADALLAVWDGRSPGTRHTLDHAHTLGLPVATRVLDAARDHTPDRPAPRGRAVQPGLTL